MDYHFTQKICEKICEDVLKIMFDRGVSYKETHQSNISHNIEDIRKMCDLLEKDADHF